MPGSHKLSRARCASWTPEVATAHEAFVQIRRATVTAEATAEQLAVAEAARAKFEIVRKKTMARAAFDLLLEVGPGSHEARRLHEMSQSVIAEVRSTRPRL